MFVSLLISFYLLCFYSYYYLRVYLSLYLFTFGFYYFYLYILYSYYYLQIFICLIIYSFNILLSFYYFYLYIFRAMITELNAIHQRTKFGDNFNTWNLHPLNQRVELGVVVWLKSWPVLYENAVFEFTASFAHLAENDFVDLRNPTC